MISNSSQSSYTQRVKMAEIFSPWTTFDVWQFDNVVITVEKIQKMFSFCIWCLKDHFPSVSEVIIFVPLTEVPRQFAREQRYRIKWLNLFINNFVERPVTSAQTFPEFNWIFLIIREEKTKFFKDSSYMNLKGM